LCPTNTIGKHKELDYEGWFSEIIQKLCQGNWKISRLAHIYSEDLMMKTDKYKKKDKKRFLADINKRGKKEIRHEHKEKTKARDELTEVIKLINSHSWEQDKETFVDLYPFEKMG